MNAAEIIRGGGRPADAHYGSSMRSMRASISSSSISSPRSACAIPFADGCAELGVLLQQAERGVFYQLLSVGAGVAGDLGKHRLLLGREMDFREGSLAE